MRKTTADKFAFTLVEVLVALIILGIGASALFQFYVYQTTVHARLGRIAVAEAMLSHQAEQALALPAHLAHDSTWIVPYRDTILEFEQSVVDSLEGLQLAFGEFPPNTMEERLWAKRPREIQLTLRVGERSYLSLEDTSDSREVLGRIFFNVGGTGRAEDQSH